MTFPWRYITVSFFIGLFLGAAMALEVRHFPQRKHSMLRRFTKELQLNDQQQAQVKVILSKGRERIHSTMDEVRKESSQEIRKILLPAQQQRFDALESKMDARMKKMRERRKDD